ncbi:hypothetical protein EVAR_4746_1 [Eumeta japonica]|uniref:Uncharacterized protein n=1 Tax=Eumeta variegata TaxID=151549 RepID=A0A4C1SYT0_EUMVA|nr:hypothetical protein EVAR_4746_1 [Eumeta japonica]
MGGRASAPQRHRRRWLLTRDAIQLFPYAVFLHICYRLPINVKCSKNNGVPSAAPAGNRERKGNSVIQITAPRSAPASAASPLKLSAVISHVDTWRTRSVQDVNIASLTPVASSPHLRTTREVSRFRIEMTEGSFSSHSPNVCSDNTTRTESAALCGLVLQSAPARRGSSFRREVAVAVLRAVPHEPDIEHGKVSIRRPPPERRRGIRL